MQNMHFEWLLLSDLKVSHSQQNSMGNHGSSGNENEWPFKLVIKITMVFVILMQMTNKKKTHRETDKQPHIKNISTHSVNVKC